MVKNILLALAKFFAVLVLLLVLLKLITFLPAQRLQPILADKLVVLQLWEKSTTQFFQNFRDTYQQIAKQKQLERTYEILYHQILTEKMLNQTIADENDLLRSKLGFFKQSGGGLLPAEIIGRSAESWSSFVMLNKGEKDGIRKEQAVIDEQGLVGYVYLTFPETAKVILLTDPRFQVSCINARNQEHGILTGQLTKPLSLQYISYNSDVQKGDLLMTSGYSHRFKRGIPIGQVLDVTAHKRNYYKAVTVQPLVDFSRLDILFVVK